MVPDLGGAIFFLALVALSGLVFMAVMILGGIASLFISVNVIGLIVTACVAALVTAFLFDRFAS